MSFKPQSPDPVRRGSDGRVLATRWTICQVASRQTWIGEIDAATEADAVKKAAMKFKHRAANLMAVRRSAVRS
jgi:hypothetical protein